MFCIQCGEKNHEQANYCHACGRSIVRPKDHDARQSTSRPHGKEGAPIRPSPRVSMESQQHSPQSALGRKVILRDPQTGETSTIKRGWSWTCFFFSGFFGAPLFMRGLTNWGLVLVGVWLFNFITNLAVRSEGLDGPGMALLLMLPWAASLWLSVFLGVRGNEITVKHYLRKGWVIISEGEGVHVATPFHAQPTGSADSDPEEQPANSTHEQTDSSCGTGKAPIFHNTAEAAIFGGVLVTALLIGAVLGQSGEFNRSAQAGRTCWEARAQQRQGLSAALDEARGESLTEKEKEDQLVSLMQNKELPDECGG